MAGVITRHLDSAASFEITFWRSAFSSLSLAVILSVMRGLVFWRRLLHAPRVIWISGVCWSIMFTAFMMAITLTTVANALIMLALGPLITALFARFLLNHRLPVITWLAIALAGVGIASMFMHEGDETFSMVGSLVALAVPLAGAVNFTLLQHVGLGKMRKPAISGDQPVQDMLQAVLIGAVLSALSTLPLSLPIRASVHDIGLLSLLGVFQLSIPCLLVVRLSRELPAPEISLLTQLEVVFGVTWAWLWAGEYLSVNTFIGGSLVLGALLANELARMLRDRRAKAARLNDLKPVELRPLL